MNNIDRVIVIILTLSIIIVGFVLENKLIMMHRDHLSIHGSTPEPQSSKDQDLEQLQRIEKAVNILLTQRNCSSDVNLTIIADALVGKLSSILGTSSERTVCAVPSDKIRSIDEDLNDSKNQDEDSSETLDDWTVIPWLCWIGLWIYRLFLTFVLWFEGFEALPSDFRDKDGKSFCQTMVFIIVSCVGYFPNVLMDVCGSHCTAWYFPLCIGMSRLLWVLAVCFINIQVDMNTKGVTDYVFLSIVIIFFMYNGFYPMMILS